MFDDMIAGLGLLNPAVLGYMLIGVVVMTVVAIIPGLGGLFALAVVLPFAFQLEPTAGIALLVAVVVVSGTGNTVTSVLFGVPGSPSGVATILDGYPMARKGLGARAVSAGVTASAVGGVVGAVVLAASLPIMRPLVLALGPPEFFVMILGALLMMSYVSQGETLKALVAGGLGLMVSFVGLEQSTSTPRYVFGQLYLWEGVQLVPVMIGLFAIAEMISLMRQGGSIAEGSQHVTRKGQVLQGVLDVFRHWRAALQSAVTGLWVGVAPGMGDAAAQFIAYAQVAKSSKNPEKFGTGVVEGVIASDATTNSKDGGALIPTLAFGIPGSSTLAVLLAAFIAFGLRPGRELLVERADLIWMIIWILVLANLAAALLSLAFIGPFARITSVRASVLVPVILVISLFGAYTTTNHVGDVITAVVFGFLGYAMKRYSWSRATFLIGFVLGELLERNYLLSWRLFGLEFLTRPITMGLIVFLVLVFAVPAIRKLLRARQRTHSNSAR